MQTLTTLKSFSFMIIFFLSYARSGCDIKTEIVGAHKLSFHIFICCHLQVKLKTHTLRFILSN